MLAKRYDERAPEVRRSKPVRIEAASTGLTPRQPHASPSKALAMRARQQQL